MTALPGGPLESESPLRVKLAKASVLALGQSLYPDSAVPGETMFLLLPGMMPYFYKQMAGVLASEPRPTVRYAFRALGAVVIGSWRTSENLERFERRAGWQKDSFREIARQHGPEHDARFLIQWAAENVVLSLEEALHWPTEFQLEFCAEAYRSATPAEQQLGANIVLSFLRPPDRLGAVGVSLR